MANPRISGVAQENPGPDSVLSLYLELHSLTESMRQHAGDGDWEKVAALEKQRQLLIERLAGCDVGEREVENVREIVQHIMELNTELLAASAALRDTLAADLTDLKRSRKAENAYRKNR